MLVAVVAPFDHAKVAPATLDAVEVALGVVQDNTIDAGAVVTATVARMSVTTNDAVAVQPLAGLVETTVKVPAALYTLLKATAEPLDQA